MVKEKKKRKSHKRGVLFVSFTHTQLRRGCTHPVFSVSINGWVFSVQPRLPSCSQQQQQQQQRCVCIVMPTSKGYIITEGRRRGLWEAVDRMRGSDWLPRQSDFRRGGAVGEVDCSAVSFSDINSLFSVTRNSSCPVGAAVFRVCWRLPNQNDAGFSPNASDALWHWDCYMRFNLHYHSLSARGLLSALICCPSLFVQTGTQCLFLSIFMFHSCCHTHC